MTTTTTASYRKTRQGQWVVYGPAATIQVGPVQVTKRDGTTRTERVVAVGRTFQVDGTDMVYGYLDDARPRPTSRTTGRTRSQTDSQDHEDCLSFGCCGPHCTYGAYPLRCRRHPH
jgi:hypothetical protein